MKSLSTPTKIFLLTAYLSGVSFLIASIIKLQITEPVMFAVLCALGSTLHIIKIEGATNRSHYTLSFLVFGFAMIHMGTPQALLVILASNLAEWIWNRPPWFIQFFNISCYVIAAEIAGLIFSAINPAGRVTSWEIVTAIVTGMAGFTFINHLLVGIVLWLARKESFKQSGIFDLVPLITDLTMMSVGASLAIVWDYNPYALLIFLIPAYPFYMALRIPSLERKTEIDQKTGLFNHQYFMTQFSSELQRANRHDRPLSIIIADLDLLRNINNTYGHLAGDEVLKGVAEVLRQTVREYDIVARFGGEEFAILMPETEVEKAIERSEYIRKAIEAARFVVPTSVEPIKATMSFGISRRESFEQSKEEILHNADTALYRSKLSGRNRALAFVNNSYLQAGSTEPIQQATESASASERDPNMDEKSTTEYGAASSSYLRRATGTDTTSGVPPEASEAQPKPSDYSNPPRTSIVRVNTYITVLAVSAVLASLSTIIHSSSAISAYSPSDWMELAALALTIVLTEQLSINLYVRNTSLSTSAVPIIALIILFGPFGTLAASLVFAISAAIKYRSPFNRIIFNFSNHIIAGMIINVLISLTGANMANPEYPLLELIITPAAALILFIFTTILISIGVGIDLKQSPYAIWKEQYQWLAPYYLGMGLISYALLFGFRYAGLLGTFTMIIPMLLLRFSQAQYIEHTRVVVNELRHKNQELERSSMEINALNEGLLETLSEIIDLRDPYVLGHSKMVSRYASDIAKHLKLSDRQIELIRKAALLHDIGKLGIATEILTKSSSLTHDEYEIVKQHAALGAELVRKSPALREIAPMIRHHHEHYDGRGYPDKLKGTQISIEARILSVADSIEAMASDRPYRKGLKPEFITDELKRYSGSQFDPLVTQAAIKMLEAKESGEVAEVIQVNHSELQLAIIATGAH